MFKDFNPYNLADANWQHWLMWIVAGTLGFIIGYISRQTTIRQLEGDLASTNRDLDDCQKTPVVVLPTSTDESSVLTRIAARASELNFDRIGLATADQADDLKDIVGVGPFLEKKLHSLGIFTFRQVANFTKEDMDKVNNIIEFFPGRIERDNWVGQSADLHKKKYS
jgi:predicted flap endonuclease-1-like 5' DNA nuclease